MGTATPPLPAPDADGPRFAFGENWRRFLGEVDEGRVAEAERSLREMLGRDDLRGASFLDVGSGSGLFSLAARRLGARVVSFDVDPASVACTRELKRRSAAGDEAWEVRAGSALDEAFLRSLGRFDVVYAWGVLHHTGDLERALALAALPVGPGGQLFLALYNDQGVRSRLWRGVKRLYCSGAAGRRAVTALFYPVFFLQGVLLGFWRHGNPAGYFAAYRERRGMSAVRDWDDWLGGYPFEVAKPGEIVARYERAGFALERIVTTRRHGCNQFVFRAAGR